MNSGKALYGRLAADETVTGLVGRRIRKVRASQNELLPYIVYRRLNTQRAHITTGASHGLPTARYMLLCYAATQEAAEILADVVRVSLDGWRDLLTTPRVQACLVDDDSDGMDNPIDGDEIGDQFVSLEIRLTYEE